jgi:hypothetical protein
MWRIVSAVSYTPESSGPAAKQVVLGVNPYRPLTVFGKRPRSSPLCPLHGI